jgi:hypothetical protein
MLVKDVCDWVNVNPVPWDGIHFDSVQIAESCKSRTLIEVFKSIYEFKAAKDGAIYWCCKSMESVQYVDTLEKSGINPYYIHIYRDGRDVAISFLKAIVGPKHVYHLAKKWSEEQLMALKLKERIAPDRFISVKYEELIGDPGNVMRRICAKLDVPYREEIIMDYFYSRESQNTANSGEMWKNVARPILKNNHHKYLRELEIHEVEIFESVAGDMLERFGYERLIESDRLITAADIQEYNQENRIKIERSLLLADPDDVSRRRPQEDLYLKIKQHKNLSMP